MATTTAMTTTVATTLAMANHQKIISNHLASTAMVAATATVMVTVL